MTFEALRKHEFERAREFARQQVLAERGELLSDPGFIAETNAYTRQAGERIRRAIAHEKEPIKPQKKGKTSKKKKSDFDRLIDSINERGREKKKKRKEKSDLYKFLKAQEE